jgi:hypothetical protein
MLPYLSWVYWESLYGAIVAGIGSIATLGILRLAAKRAT